MSFKKKSNVLNDNPSPPAVEEMCSSEDVTLIKKFNNKIIDDDNKLMNLLQNASKESQDIEPLQKQNENSAKKIDEYIVALQDNMVKQLQWFQEDKTRFQKLIEEWSTKNQAQKLQLNQEQNQYNTTREIYEQINQLSTNIKKQQPSYNYAVETNFNNSLQPQIEKIQQIQKKIDLSQQNIKKSDHKIQKYQKYLKALETSERAADIQQSKEILQNYVNEVANYKVSFSEIQKKLLSEIYKKKENIVNLNSLNENLSGQIQEQKSFISLQQDNILNQKEIIYCLKHQSQDPQQQKQITFEEQIQQENSKLDDKYPKFFSFKFLDNLEQKYLGSGTFGKVYEICLNSKSLALKKFTKISLPKLLQNDQDSLFNMILMFNEANSMSIINQIDCPYLLKLEGISFEVNQKQDFIFYSLTEKKSYDLVQAIYKKFINNRSQKIKIIQQLALALQAFQKPIFFNNTASNQFSNMAQLVHGDLKPQNILLDEKLQIFIADFGSFKIASQQTQLQGISAAPFTVEYAPPEAYLTNDHRTPAFDLWSFGCIILFIFTEVQPWKVDQFKYQEKHGYPYNIKNFFDQAFGGKLDLIQHHRAYFEEELKKSFPLDQEENIGILEIIKQLTDYDVTTRLKSAEQVFKKIEILE